MDNPTNNPYLRLKEAQEARVEAEENAPDWKTPSGALLGGALAYKGFSPRVVDIFKPGKSVFSASSDAIEAINAQLSKAIGVPVDMRNMTPDQFRVLTSQLSDELTPGEKYAAKTGFGKPAQTVEESSAKWKRSIPQGKVSKRFAERWGQSAPGEPMSAFDRMLARSKAAEAEAAADAARKAAMAEEFAKAQKAIEAERFKAGVKKMGLGALSGALSAYELPEVYRLQQKEGVTPEVATRGLAGLGGLGALGLATGAIPGGQFPAAVIGAMEVPELARLAHNWYKENTADMPAETLEAISNLARPSRGL